MQTPWACSIPLSIEILLEGTGVKFPVWPCPGLHQKYQTLASERASSMRFPAHPLQMKLLLKMGLTGAGNAILQECTVHSILLTPRKCAIPAVGRRP